MQKRVPVQPMQNEQFTDKMEKAAFTLRKEHTEFRDRTQKRVLMARKATQPLREQKPRRQLQLQRPRRQLQLQADSAENRLRTDLKHGSSFRHQQFFLQPGPLLAASPSTTRGWSRMSKSIFSAFPLGCAEEALTVRWCE